jgi:hypothetical protein
MTSSDVSTSNTSTTALLQFKLDYKGNTAPTSATLVEENTKKPDVDVTSYMVDDELIEIPVKDLDPSGFNGFTEVPSIYDYKIDIVYDDDDGNPVTTFAVDFAPFTMSSQDDPTVFEMKLENNATNPKSEVDVTFDFTYGESPSVIDAEIEY